MNAYAPIVTYAVLLGSWVGAASATPTKTAAFDNLANFNSNIAVDSGTFVAQSFITADTIDLTKISVYINNVFASPDTITLQIRADAGGNPGAVLGSATLPPTSNDFQWVDFNFTLGSVSLAAGTLYYIELSNFSSAGQGYDWAADHVQGSDPGYPSGSAFFSTNQGASWFVLNSGTTNYDMLFQVWGEAVPEPTSTTLLGVGILALLFASARRGRQSDLTRRCSQPLAAPMPHSTL
jgi:hypothetical protein